MYNTSLKNTFCNTQVSLKKKCKYFTQSSCTLLNPTVDLIIRRIQVWIYVGLCTCFYFVLFMLTTLKRRNRKLSCKEHFEDWNITLKLTEIQSVILSVCQSVCHDLYHNLICELSVTVCQSWDASSEDRPALCFFTFILLYGNAYLHIDIRIFLDSLYTSFQYLKIHRVNRLSRPGITRKILDFLVFS